MELFNILFLVIPDNDCIYKIINFKKDLESYDIHKSNIKKLNDEHDELIINSTFTHLYLHSCYTYSNETIFDINMIDLESILSHHINNISTEDLIKIQDIAKTSIIKVIKSVKSVKMNNVLV